ncbi:MAG: bifunctional metallophosphatase/5'-nucleotidase [Clostridia bacterium]|nr:bifunctional metallophosphatase/5'-nucleotidase [Clostridia bacterium]
MKRFFKLFSIIIALIVVCNTAFCVAFAEESAGTVILYTNDVHCATEHYATLAAYRAELIDQGYEVITVDSGDAIQGEMIGTLTEGAAITEIMNAVGYDYAAIGNHEFDYTVPQLLTLAENAEFEYLCVNFRDLINNKDVFAPYAIKDIGGTQYAFIGIATPETYSKTTPAYFQNENGDFIYSFLEDSFYASIQNAIDDATAEGAEIIIALGHLGISGTTEGWRSADVIANTAGIDIFLDAHAHETIESAIYPDKNQKSVLLSSTGTKLNKFGVLKITENGYTAELIDPNSIQIDTLCENAKSAYNTVSEIVNGYKAEFEYLYEIIGESEAKLAIYDENGIRRVRSGETNAGNFVTDAYKAVLGADIAFVNGGGVRAELPIGEFTRKAVMDINPWNNEMCVIEVTGQQLADALEYGTHAVPNEYGSFPHIAGLSFELHSYIPSSVVIDELDNFVSIDENAERRVKNIKINGEPIDPNQKYTLAGSCYMLLQNGYTMFKDAKIIESEGLPTDTEVLVEYVTSHLNGKITDEQYGNIYGEGRMKTVSNPQENEPVVPNDESNIYLWFFAAMLAAAVAVPNLKRKA